jgi:hypothetical protein
MNPDAAQPTLTPESVVAEPAPGAPKGGSWPKRHRKLLLIVAGTIVAAAGAGVLGWSLAKPKPAPAVVSPKATSTPSPSPTAVTKLSPLTGEPVDPALADRPISAVVIENHTDARPQSGLQDAGVLYEANAEGGITRFEAFFLDKRPAQIGPVRSLRTYFVDWGLEFNSPVAHAGGNADALDEVNPLKMKDINALSFAADGFYRTSDRVAPHNLYTTSDKLDAVVKRLGFAQPANFAPSPRKKDAPNPTPPHPKRPH